MTCNKLYTMKKKNYDFVVNFKNLSPSNYTVLSLDAKSLYTKVQIPGCWIVEKKGYLNFITLPMKLKNF